MNVANKDLCQELYELSGWVNDFTYVYWERMSVDKVRGAKDKWIVKQSSLGNWKEGSIPAYDSGYLLKKLPRTLPIKDYKSLKARFKMYPMEDVKSEYWVAEYQSIGRVHTTGTSTKQVSLGAKADTPENALTKLAIELFKQGILTK